MLFTLAFYSIFWNGVLSNLKLSIPMAYAVHSRFWMQPNLIMCVYSGLAASFLVAKCKASVRLPLVRVIFISLTLCFATLRFPHADRSDAVYNSLYGRAILDSIPDGSVLLSHTDLDWNTVRYLRKCEGLKPNVLHLSAQLLPYPWFQRQINAGLYKNLVFPPILPGVSTSRYDEGNKLLLSRFFEANIDSYENNMFVDMQAISDNDLKPGGVWRGFMLIPHGLVYRVTKLPPSLDFLAVSRTYPESISSLSALPKASLSVLPKYKAGTWEYGEVELALMLRGALSENFVRLNNRIAAFLLLSP